MEPYYVSCHGNSKNFIGQARQDKTDVFKRELKAQQITLQWYCKTDNDIIQKIYKISKLIAMKLKPHVQGEFVKECVATATKLLAKDKVTSFQNVSLSRTASNRIQEIGDDKEKTLKDKLQFFKFVAQTLDKILM